MTWTYEITGDNSQMIIYDHDGDKVRTLENDGNGFEIPTIIESIMRDEAEKARSNNNMSRWRDIHIRLADNDILVKS